jgi:pantoate--beta-alanine ligase
LLLFTHIQPLAAYIQAQKGKGATVGLVPTMGALHQGHLSLIAQSKATTNLTVCSIFVNPTQFNNQEDLVKYPRTMEQDTILLVQSGCDVLFHPDAHEMYPNGLQAGQYDWGNITNTLEGAFRPGHFDGVITIVKRLFDIVKPNKAFFGQKDFQQSAVIHHLANFFGLPIDIVVGETLREPDGLAMSSRNIRLSLEERNQALTISQTLYFIKENKANYSIVELRLMALQLLKSAPMLKVEYLEIVDKTTLSLVEDNKGLEQSVVLIAVWCGNVRLIDNMVLGD